ncbi:MAG: hypothetical protein V1731_02535, partial [Candidatus Aenigmatarchaeota archaeon]
VHGIASVLEGDVKVHPSRELINDISILKDGESVGIEFPRRMCKGYEITTNVLDIDGEQTDLAGVNYYWSKILEACGKKNLRVSFLDNLGLIEQAISKRIKSIREYRESLALEFSEEPGAKEKVMELRRASYADDVEGRYVHDIMRENHILNMMKKSKPALAVVGRGHGDFFFMDRAQLEKRGIVINTYRRENTFHTLPLEESMIDAPAFAYVDRDETNRDEGEKLMSQRDSLQRMYNASKKGRVMAWKPDFIGTWDTKIPARGLFEVYINHRRKDGSVDGVIEDCIGGARFEGAIRNGDVSFRKSYLDSARWTGGAAGVIRYEGAREADGVYRGKFGGPYVDPRMNNGVDFEMRPFSVISR